MKRHTRSCSCINCAYKSSSNRPSVQQLIEDGTDIDKLFYGKYLPLRERKLLEKLIRTRAIYDDVRDKLLSSSENSDQTKSEYTFRSQGYESATKSSVILKAVDLVDRGQIRSPSASRLSSCCNCCSCSSVKKIQKHLEKHPHPRVHKHEVPSDNIAQYRERAEKRARARRKRLGSKIGSTFGAVRFKGKDIRSEPCFCTLSFNSLVKRSSKALVKKFRSKDATITHRALKSFTDVKTKPRKKPLQKIKGIRESLTKSVGSEIENSKRFRIKKDSITLFREKMKNRRILSANQCEETCDPEECEPEICYNQILAKNVDQIKRKKERFKRSETISERDRTRVPKTKTHLRKVSCACMDTESYARVEEFANIKNRTTSSATSISKQERSKIPKHRPSQTQKNQTRRILKRCFCTLKLRKKKHKVIRSTSKKTMVSIRIPLANRKSRVRKTQTKSTGIAYFGPPTGTRGSLLPYECEPFVCTPGKCDPYDCLKKIKARNRKELQTKLSNSLYSLKKTTSSFISRKKISDAKIQSNSIKKETRRMHTKEAEIQRPRGYDAMSQIIKKEKNKKTHTAPFLQRCFCTLKLFNKEISRKRKATMTPLENKNAGNVKTRNKATHPEYLKHRKPIECECEKFMKLRDIKLDKYSGTNMTSRSTYSETQDRNFAPKTKTDHYPKRTEGLVDYKQIKRHKIIKAHKDIYGYSRLKLLPYECEPGVCIPNQCNPYECEKLVKQRNKNFKNKYSGSSLIRRSTYSETPKPITFPETKIDYYPREIKKQSQEYMPVKTHEKIKARNEKYPYEHSKLLPYECEPGVCIPGQCDPYECEKLIKLRKKENFVRNKPIRKHEKSKARQIKLKTRGSQQLKTSSHHKAITGKVKVKEKGIYVGSAMEPCFCTLKLHKKGRYAKFEDAYAANKDKKSYFEVQGPKPTTGSKSTGTNKNHRHDLKSYECAPDFCIPGICDPYECYNEIKRREAKQYHDQYIGTERVKKKSTTSMTSSELSISKKSKHLQANITENIIQENKIKTKQEQQSVDSTYSPSRQVVRIGSNFSFSIDFYKDRSASITKDNNQQKHKPSSEITVTTRSKEKREKQRKNALRNHFSRNSNIVDKEDRASNVGHLLKRCFCTLKLHKKENASKIRRHDYNRTRPVTTQFMQMAHRNNKSGGKFEKPHLVGIRKEDRVIKSTRNIKEKNFDLYLQNESDNLARYESKISITRQNKFQTNYTKNSSHIISNMGLDIEFESNRNSKGGLRPKYYEHQRGYLLHMDNQAHLIKNNPFYRSYYALNLKVSEMCKAAAVDDYSNRIKFKKQTGLGGHKSRTVKNHNRSNPTARLMTQSIRDKPGSTIGSKTSFRPSTQITRIGSTFSYNMNFTKTSSSDSPSQKQLSISHIDKRPTILQAYTSSVRTDNVKSKGFRRDPYDLNYSDITNQDVSTEDTSSYKTSKLRRCFCTLGSQNKQRITKVDEQIKSEKNKSTMVRHSYGNVIINKNQKTNTDKLEPYECAPGVFIPGECDPHECYKLIQQKLRKNRGQSFVTVLPKSKSVSIDASKKSKFKSIKTDRSARIARSKYVPNMPVELQKSVLPPSQRQAVRFGSNFSFNIEFFKDNTLDSYPMSHTKEIYQRPRISPSLSTKSQMATRTRRLTSNGQDGDIDEAVSRQKRFGANSMKSGPIMPYTCSGLAQLFSKCLCNLRTNKEAVYSLEGSKTKNDHGDGPGYEDVKKKPDEKQIKREIGEISEYKSHKQNKKCKCRSIKHKCRNKRRKYKNNKENVLCRCKNKEHVLCKCKSHYKGNVLCRCKSKYKEHVLCNCKTERIPCECESQMYDFDTFQSFDDDHYWEPPCNLQCKAKRDDKASTKTQSHNRDIQKQDDETITSKVETLKNKKKRSKSILEKTKTNTIIKAEQQSTQIQQEDVKTKPNKKGLNTKLEAEPQGKPIKLENKNVKKNKTSKSAHVDHRASVKMEQLTLLTQQNNVYTKFSECDLQTCKKRLNIKTIVDTHTNSIEPQKPEPDYKKIKKKSKSAQVNKIASIKIQQDNSEAKFSECDLQTCKKRLNTKLIIEPMKMIEEPSKSEPKIQNKNKKYQSPKVKKMASIKIEQQKPLIQQEDVETNSNGCDLQTCHKRLNTKPILVEPVKIIDEPRKEEPKIEKKNKKNKSTKTKKVASIKREEEILLIQPEDVETNPTNTIDTVESVKNKEDTCKCKLPKDKTKCDCDKYQQDPCKCKPQKADNKIKCECDKYKPNPCKCKTQKADNKIKCECDKYKQDPCKCKPQKADNKTKCECDKYKQDPCKCKPQKADNKTKCECHKYKEDPCKCKAQLSMAANKTKCECHKYKDPCKCKPQKSNKTKCECDKYNGQPKGKSKCECDKYYENACKCDSQEPVICECHKSKGKPCKCKGNPCDCDIKNRRFRSKSTKVNYNALSVRSDVISCDKSTCMKGYRTIKSNYECEPDVCIPGACNPKLCFKIFKSKKQVKDTAVSTPNAPLGTKSVSTCPCDQKPSILKRCFCILTLQDKETKSKPPIQKKIDKKNDKSKDLSFPIVSCEEETNQFSGFIRKCFCKVGLKTDGIALKAKPSTPKIVACYNDNIKSTGASLKIPAQRIDKPEQNACPAYGSSEQCTEMETIMPYSKKKFKKQDLISKAPLDSEIKLPLPTCNKCPLPVCRECQLFKKLLFPLPAQLRPVTSRDKVSNPIIPPPSQPPQKAENTEKIKKEKKPTTPKKKTKKDKDNLPTDVQCDPCDLDELERIHAQDPSLPTSLKDPLFEMVIDAKTMNVKNTDEILRSLGTGRLETGIVKQGRLAIKRGEVPSPITDLIIDRCNANIMNSDEFIWSLDPSGQNKQKSKKRFCDNLKTDTVPGVVVPCESPITPCGMSDQIPHKQGCKCCDCRHSGGPRARRKPTPPKPPPIIHKRKKTVCKVKGEPEKKKEKIKIVKPCVCGTRICEKETKKVALQKELDAKPRLSPCICGSRVCKEARMLTPEFIKKAQKKAKLLSDQKKEVQRKKMSAVKKLKKERQKRLRRYKHEDHIRRKRRKKEDKIAMKNIEQYKRAGDGLLLGESVKDIGKFGASAICGLLKSTFRVITNPIDSLYRLREARKDPKLAIKSVVDSVMGSGVAGTAKRIQRRLGAMQSTQYMVAAMESHPLSNYMVHFADKDPKKRLKKIKPTREPLDFECSLFMGSLRQKPCLWIYYLCPWFYPHCISLLNLWRQFTDVLLFVLAVGVWSPCILCMEICRAMMCCFLCTG